MISSNEEFIAIVGAATGHNDCSSSLDKLPSQNLLIHLPRWAKDVQEMLDGVAELEFSPQQRPPLQKICEAGSEYGVKALEKTTSHELLSLLQPKAKQRIQRDLRRILARITRPSFTLELNAFRCAYKAIYSQTLPSTAEMIERKFLGERPYDRLSSLFKKFPVLAQLWSQLICQWCDSVSEFLARVERDKLALSRVFFCRQPVGKIIDLRVRLSDPHNKGRTVMHVRFQAGSIIYKPRPGQGEQEWLRLVDYLNARSLGTKLRAARVLLCDGYCWMEEIRSAPCKNQPAARRFYKRVGAMIGAAYLLKAVDCHRGNIIASGEHPVLVDAETLWHDTKTQSSFDILYGTGFLPSSGRRSSHQYRSSVLGKATPGKHTPHLGARPLSATHYETEIINGFCSVWRCLLGKTSRRAAFVRRVQRLRGQERRWIYWSTRNYDEIRRASIQPAVLRSGIERNLVIAKLCERSGVPRSVIRKEINALKRLDIPYFIRKISGEPLLVGDNAAPTEILAVLRHALHL